MLFPDAAPNVGRAVAGAAGGIEASQIYNEQAKAEQDYNDWLADQEAAAERVDMQKKNLAGVLGWITGDIFKKKFDVDMDFTDDGSGGVIAGLSLEIVQERKEKTKEFQGRFFIKILKYLPIQFLYKFGIIIYNIYY